MMPDEQQAGIPLSVKGNAIQLMVMVEGLTDMQGQLINDPILKTQNGEIELKVPKAAFPFLVPGVPVSLTLSMVQVTIGDMPWVAANEKTESGLVIPAGSKRATKKKPN